MTGRSPGFRGSSCHFVWAVWLLSVGGGVASDQHGGLVLGLGGSGEEFEGAGGASHFHGVAGSGAEVAEQVLVGAGRGPVGQCLGAGLACRGSGAVHGGDGFFGHGPVLVGERQGCQGGA